MMKSFAKGLTKNDTGETGGHQGGVCVPKRNKELIDFFPELDVETFNPEAWITCTDPDGEVWEMRYIYYNGKRFDPPLSTRNEYRITYMTKFFSKWGAKSGDKLVFTAGKRTGDYEVHIDKCKENMPESVVSESVEPLKPVVLRGWSKVC